METKYKYYKNSNTGELIIKQSFENTHIRFPDNFYNANHREIKNPDLTGFVEIGEKKFRRESKRIKK